MVRVMEDGRIDRRPSDAQALGRWYSESLANLKLASGALIRDQAQICLRAGYFLVYNSPAQQAHIIILCLSPARTSSSGAWLKGPPNLQCSNHHRMIHAGPGGLTRIIPALQCSGTPSKSRVPTSRVPVGRRRRVFKDDNSEIVFKLAPGQWCWRLGS